MPVFRIRGFQVEVSSGGQHATAKRAEILDDGGHVIQSAAEASFGVIAGVDAPTPQVQAIRWLQGVPKIIETQQPPQDATTVEAKDGVENGQ